MLRRLNIRSKLLVTVALPLLLLLGVGAVALPTFQTVKVNGPAYSKIKDLQNLRADVLPPPELLLEAHLLSASMLQKIGDGMTDASLLEARDQMSALEARYRVQHDYWSERLTDTELQKSLLTDSFTPADAYFQTFDKEYYPLLNKAFSNGFTTGSRSGDAAFEAYGDAQEVFRKKLDPLYAQHRTAVDAVVARTDSLLRKTESDTNDLISTRLTVLVLITLLALVAAAVVGTAVARAISRPVKRLTDAANAAARDELPRVVAQVQDGRDAEIVPVPAEGDDELGQLAQAFNAMQSTAVNLAAEQARVRKNVAENLVNLGRRNQVLLGRTLSFVTQLEESERDPKRLEDLFRLDHLTTRMRRNAESLLVLAGAEPPRMWSEPIEIGDVVRAALSEIEEYRRVELTGMEPAKMQGAVVGDVAHLLAELLENATSFSAPTSKVSVLGKRRSDGYLIVIVDEGFGMSREELDQCNRRLSEPASFDSSPTKVLGLHVVGKLAQRHGIRAELTESFSVGTAARILLPDSLFDAGAPNARGAMPGLVSAPAPAAPSLVPVANRSASVDAPSSDMPTPDEFDALFNVPFGTQGGLSHAISAAAAESSAATATAATAARVAPAPVDPGPRPLTRRREETRRDSSATPTPAPGSAPVTVPSVLAPPTVVAPPVVAPPVATPPPMVVAPVSRPTVESPAIVASDLTPTAPVDAPLSRRTPSPVDVPPARVVAEPSGPTAEVAAIVKTSALADVTAGLEEDWLSDMALAHATGPLLDQPIPVVEVNPAIVADRDDAMPHISDAVTPTAPAQTVPAEAEPEAAAGGLRKRVRGAQMPDTGPAAAESDDDLRDPGAVRAVLGGLQRRVEDARRSNEDPQA